MIKDKSAATSSTFKTEDGYTLFRKIDKTTCTVLWTDGDLEFDSDTDGHPIDVFGERLQGEYVR